MALDSARPMTALWPQRQKSIGPWPAFTRAGQGTWPRALQTWFATGPSPVGQSELKERFLTFGEPWRTSSWSQLPRDVPLELHETLYILPKKGLEWLWWYPFLTMWFKSCSWTCFWTKCAREHFLITVVCAFWSARTASLSLSDTLTCGSLSWGGIADKASAASSDT